ncbi:hypothetical protein AWN76_011740 [Rhodothermaceae bacterium RA]|nr:hypothetical protein AWN76_011740 [Rhodothermaceae bacterium RA]
MVSTGVSTEGAACACTPVTAHLDVQEVEALAAQLKALAHPIRLRMVDLIHAHGGQLCVCEFEQHFDVKQPTISHHLKILREAGLIRSRQEGAWVHHAVEPAAFAHLRALMARFAAEGEVPSPETAIRTA